jgi:cytochrome c oxidase assembly protein subunit 15
MSDMNILGFGFLASNVNFRQYTPNKIIASWLFLLCGMVFVMVIIGGLTRLTHSGLSMVDWRPLTGWLPPMSANEWQAVFNLYKGSPEFEKINYDMTVESFKSIFWLEFVHRLWGRIMGIVFLLPIIVFAMKGWITRHLWPRLLVIFLLAVFQGALGWYMVKSGLIDNPDVSQYRLAAHFSAAVVIYGYMFWIALSLIETRQMPLRDFRSWLSIVAIFTSIWIFITMLSGGFVAGLDAGLVYNTFPLMDGHLVPEGLWSMSPGYINFFENITTVQFNHRILAEMTLILVTSTWWIARKNNLPMVSARAFDVLFGMVLVQVTLGVSTLMFVVPIALASLHQIGSLVLFTFALWAVHSILGRQCSC